jgi:hypothetical protein
LLSSSPETSVNPPNTVSVNVQFNPLFDESTDKDIIERAMPEIPENAPLESVWRQVWSKDEIHLIYNLFLLTDQSPTITSNTNTNVDMKHNRVGYISSIEDILRAKEEIIDDGIHRANLWI